jgi:hypothetical protein
MTAGTIGSIICVGRSGNTYCRQAWFTDAVGASMRFDQGAGVSATLGETFTTFPEDVSITDICVTTTATPAATTFRLTLNGAPTSQMFVVAGQLTSTAFRPPLRLLVPFGSRLGGIMTT